MARTWAEEMGKNTDWVKSLGGQPLAGSSGAERAEFHELPGADCVRIYRLHQESGYEYLWKLLKAAVDKRRIEVLYATN